MNSKVIRHDSYCSNSVWTKNSLIYPLLLITQFLWISTLGTARYVAPDEGFYLLAAELVSQGKVPYLDFFYPQAPYQPYIIASWFKIFGASWLSARIFTSLLFSLIGLLIFARLRNNCRTFSALTGLILFNTSALALNWFLPIKNYGLTAVLLYTSYYLIAVTPNRLRGFLAGIFLASAIGCRSYVAILAPACVLIIFFKNRRLLLPFIFGGLVGGSPMLVLCCLNPEKFWFNNLGYHLLRSNWSIAEALEQKKLILQGLLGLRAAIKFASLQIPLLIWTAIISAILTSIKRLRFDWSLLFIGALLLISFVPTPSQVQYFSILIPFLITNIILLINPLLTRGFGKQLYLLGLLIITFTYGWGFSSDLRSFTEQASKTNQGYKGTALVPPHSIFELDALALELAKLNPEKKELVAIWPGYLFNSQASFVPEIVNNFGLNIGQKLSITEQENFHVTSMRSLKQKVKAGVPLLIINQRSAKVIASPKLLQASYQEIYSQGDTKVFKLKTP